MPRRFKVEISKANTSSRKAACIQRFHIASEKICFHWNACLHPGCSFFVVGKRNCYSNWKARGSVLQSHSKFIRCFRWKDFRINLTPDKKSDRSSNPIGPCTFLRVSKSGERLILCFSSWTSSDGFWKSKVVKGSVRNCFWPSVTLDLE